MQITAIRLDRLSMPLDPPFAAAWDPRPRRHADAVIVRVETDEGVVGVGSGDTMAGLDGREHLFVGRDPLQVQRHVRTIESINFHGGRCWPLEVALWDIVGQVTGVPVATLFGGALDRVPAYASCGSLLAPRERAESAVALREEGFRALKVRIDRRRPDFKHRAFTPHTWTNGVGLLANLHVVAGIGGGPFLEFPYDPPGWTPQRRDFMLTEPVRIDADGCVPVPPGIGAELDLDALNRWRVT
ncbi:MAG: hypothetical protein LH603_21300 [Pseudonocardia sp.]|nr:hypothetical protein [Pseudonocardia sp.]